MTYSPVANIPHGPISGIFAPPFCPIFDTASSALSTSATQISVYSVVWMSSGAERLSCTFGRGAIAAKGISCPGDSLKMRGINTSPISAEMVNGETRRDRPTKMLVRKSVGIHTSIIDSEHAITILFNGSSPQPTTWCLFGKCKETILRWPLFVKSLSGKLLAAARVINNHVVQLYAILPPTRATESLT